MNETRDDLREAMQPILRERDRWGDKRFNYGDHREVWLTLGVVRRLCAAYEAANLAQVSALQAEVERLQKVEGERGRLERVPSGPCWSDKLEPQSVSALRATITSREPLHLVTQSGQPYGSVRRCCERCGQMCWPGMKGSATRWTDDRDAYANASDRCDGGEPNVCA